MFLYKNLFNKKCKIYHNKSQTLITQFRNQTNPSRYEKF